MATTERHFLRDGINRQRGRRHHADQVARHLVELFWDAFTGFRRSERVVVLYLKAGTYMIVSRAKFPLARDWEAFLQVLGDKLKQR